MAIKIYSRLNKEIYEEEEYGQKSVNFLYNNFFGRIILRLLISRKFFSKIASIYYHTKFSVKDIPEFIEKNNIDMSDYEEKEYSSFNDFFTRKILVGKRPLPTNNDSLIAVADSKLSVYNIDENQKVNIKGIEYTVEELVDDRELARNYVGGKCLIFRLCVDDYHRFSYIEKGNLDYHKVIKGSLHTVRDTAKKFRFYAKNQRELEVLNTTTLGKVVQIDVGAIMIGKIKNYHLETFERGEEKGYFYYGGSTVVVLIEKEKILIDEDITKYSNEDIEVKVKLGEKIGVVLNN